MKKNITLFFLLIVSTNSYCQGRNNIWCFGDSALLDFNTGAPVPGSSGMNGRGTACSIADENGNLLFYSSDPLLSLWSIGYRMMGVVYNNNHQIMDNGDSLHGELAYQEQVITPDPGDSSRYYLFHLQAGVSFVGTGLFFSTIDLRFNNGLGRVISKNNQLISGDMAGCISAIKHANGRDWWIVTRKSNAQTGGPGDRDYYFFLVTPTGIQNYGIQTIGTINESAGTEIKFNKRGDQMIFTNYMGLIELYDFDRCSGLLSNPLTIQNPGQPYPNTFSAEFSATGNRLYTVACYDTAFLYQYDLTQATIPASKQTIYTFSIFPGAGGVLKRGPNNLIYWSICYVNHTVGYPYPANFYNMYNTNLSVITKPEALGLACNFQPFSLYLGGKRTYWGLPNNPDYDMQALGGTVCDSLGLFNDITGTINEQQLDVFPNPSSDKLFIQFHSANWNTSSLDIYNSLGEKINYKIIQTGNSEIGISTDSWNSGIYFLSWITDNGIFNAKFLKD